MHKNETFPYYILIKAISNISLFRMYNFPKLNFLLSSFFENKRHYLAYFPRVFRSGVTENIMLSTHGYPRPVSINVRLMKDKDNEYTSVSKVINPGKSMALGTCADLEVRQNYRWSF